VTLAMLIVERFLTPKPATRVGIATVTGTTVLFIGTVIWVFVDTALHGPGYILATLGLVITGSALAATLWYGTIGPHAPEMTVEPAAAGETAG
jgi:hypothetical protein